MEVILKEDVSKLGARGDVVKVAEGYGRNFLLPRKLAIEANAGNKAVIAQMKAASVRRSAKEKSQAEELAKQFEGLIGFVPAPLGRARSVIRLGHLRRHCRRHCKKGNQPGSQPDPAPRAAEDLGRVHRAGEAAQGRDRAFEGCDREGSGRRVVLENPARALGPVFVLSCTLSVAPHRP